jgi:hypothetical protein
MQVVRDHGGANPVAKTLAPSGFDSLPDQATDRVIWHGSSAAGRFTAIIFDGPAPSGDGCHFSADILVG